MFSTLTWQKWSGAKICHFGPTGQLPLIFLLALVQLLVRQNVNWEVLFLITSDVKSKHRVEDDGSSNGPRLVRWSSQLWSSPQNSELREAGGKLSFSVVVSLLSLMCSGNCFYLKTNQRPVSVMTAGMARIVEASLVRSFGRELEPGTTIPCHVYSGRRARCEQKVFLVRWDFGQNVCLSGGEPCSCVYPGTISCQTLSSF